MSSLFKALDASQDGRISKAEFLKILDKPDAIRLLHDVDVDVYCLVDLVPSIFTEECLDGVSEPVEKDMDFEGLMEVVLELRGSNVATVRHVMELRKAMRSATTQTNKTLAFVEQGVQELLPETS